MGIEQSKRPEVQEAIDAAGGRIPKELDRIEEQIAELRRLVTEDPLRAAVLAHAIDGQFRTVSDLAILNARKDHSVRDVVRATGIANGNLTKRVDKHLAGERSVQDFLASRPASPEIGF